MLQSPLTSAALRFSHDITRLKNPADILSALQQILRPQLNIRVGGFWYLPKDGPSDFARLVPGKTLLLPGHEAMWREFLDLIREHGSTVLTEFGRRQSAPYTLAEARRVLRPAGQEDWIFRLLQRYGIRDALYCPFRHWTLCFWSAKALDQVTADVRGILFMAAGHAIGRIDRLVEKPQRFQTTIKLTDRELSVLRQASYGKSVDEIAAHLQISPATVKTHLKHVVHKCKAKNRGHAIAQAFRQGLLI